ncbi:hypothetical protein LIER_09588 [Lithospermum erythrorhizon]|uniref:DUF676 domain-containing protein n=1 Tax=Lithospermum erythrorhizon TaxID=34254 RepID=A0AAV3PJ56_LITER
MDNNNKSDNVVQNNLESIIVTNDGNNNIVTHKKNKIKKMKYGFIVRKFRCLRAEDDVVKETDAAGNFDVEAAGGGKDHAPSHLIIMVNGIIGSAENWKYAAKQFAKAYPDDVLVHCSDANSNMLTFDGVDVMGNRLANEVLSVVQRHPNLEKISIIGHSLGGVVARYAIARLYEEEKSKQVSQNGPCKVDGSDPSCLKEEPMRKIAGLEPVSFITSATPHLGSSGHKQVPMFCGLYTLEKVASGTSALLGRTGKHLFLTDSDDGKPPLLLRMANDTEDLKFISALRSFKRRVAYANARFDNLVGWSTSSLRRRSELPKLRNLSRNNKYPHIVNIETAEASTTQNDFSTNDKLNQRKRAEMEEAMIRGLTRLSWERIDVSFKGSKQRYLAHSTIQVKTKWLNSDGSDVIQHMVDSFLL